MADSQRVALEAGGPKASTPELAQGSYTAAATAVVERPNVIVSLVDEGVDDVSNGDIGANRSLTVVHAPAPKTAPVEPLSPLGPVEMPRSIHTLLWAQTEKREGR